MTFRTTRPTAEAASTTAASPSSEAPSQLWERSDMPDAAVSVSSTRGRKLGELVGFRGPITLQGSAFVTLFYLV